MPVAPKNLETLKIYLTLMKQHRYISKHLSNPNLDPVKRTILGFQYEMAHLAFEMLGWGHPPKNTSFSKIGADFLASSEQEKKEFLKIAGDAADVERRGLNMF